MKRDEKRKQKNLLTSCTHDDADTYYIFSKGEIVMFRIKLFSNVLLAAALGIRTNSTQLRRRGLSTRWTDGEKRENVDSSEMSNTDV